MKTDITLREPYSYSLSLLIIFALIVIIPPLVVVIVKLIMMFAGKKNKRVRKEKPKKITKSYIEKLREGCLEHIAEIEKRYKDGITDYRAAYIELSYTVREFVQAVSGNNATNLTLEEIKELSRPELYSLIKQFYEPEFAFERGNAENENPFLDAGRVVEKWN